MTSAKFSTKLLANIRLKICLMVKSINIIVFSIESQYFIQLVDPKYLFQKLETYLVSLRSHAIYIITIYVMLIQRRGSNLSHDGRNIHHMMNVRIYFDQGLFVILFGSCLKRAWINKNLTTRIKVFLLMG